MMPPPLSVVMPVHNGMPYVEEGVQSILRQSLLEFEFVIGDDASSDGTSQVLKRLAAGDRRIRLLRRDNKSGPAAAANWVVSAATAPIIAIAHADDVSVPARLDRQFQLLQATTDAVLIGSVYEGIDSEGQVVHPPNLWRLIRNSPFASFAHSSVMFRRDAFELAGGYRPEADYWEDLDLYWRMVDHGKVLVVPEVLVSYRYSPVSVRMRDHPLRMENAFDLMYRSSQIYAQHGDREELLLGKTGRARITPRIFVARSWTHLWSGKRPQLLGAMLRRADIGLNLASVTTIVFLTWASISPRSLRSFLQLVTRVRNCVSRQVIGNVDWLEWQPRKLSSVAVTRPTSRHDNET